MCWVRADFKSWKSLQHALNITQHHSKMTGNQQEPLGGASHLNGFYPQYPPMISGISMNIPTYGMTVTHWVTHGSHIYIYMHIHTCINMCINMYINMYTHTYIYIYMYVWMHPIVIWMKSPTSLGSWIPRPSPSRAPAWCGLASRSLRCSCGRASRCRRPWCGPQAPGSGPGKGRTGRNSWIRVDHDWLGVKIIGLR